MEGLWEGKVVGLGGHGCLSIKGSRGRFIRKRKILKQA